MLTLPNLQLASSISSKHELRWVEFLYQHVINSLSLSLSLSLSCSSTIFSLSSDRHGAFISADSQLRHFAFNTHGVATEGMAGEQKKS